MNFQGVQINVHRLTFQGWINRPINPNLDLSHTKFCGMRTASNINPRHIIEESNEENQTRKMCFLYMRMQLRRFFLPINPAMSILDRVTLITRIKAGMEMCGVVHHKQPCDLDWATWVDDHPINLTPGQMEEIYRQQAALEPEIPASESSGLGTSVYPWSSSPPGR